MRWNAAMPEPVTAVDSHAHVFVRGTPRINSSHSSVQFTVVGKYIVQFRTVDNAGNTTAWAPAASGSANTACIK